MEEIIHPLYCKQMSSSIRPHEMTNTQIDPRRPNAVLTDVACKLVKFEPAPKIRHGSKVNKDITIVIIRWQTDVEVCEFENEVRMMPVS